MGINIGIIGLGYWGPNLLRNFASAPGGHVVIGCDINEERIHKIAPQYPTLGFTRMASDVLGHPEVDAVAIATPVRTHYRLARAALLAGKHVLVTKPLTADVAEASDLVGLAKEMERVLMVDHTFVYHPAVDKLKELVESGELGDLYYFDSVRINLGLFQPDVSVIWDLAPHDISIMEHLIGRPVESVQAVGACHGGPDVESMAYVTLKFQGNILGHCHVNWLAPMKIRQIMVGGSRRMAVYDDNLVTEKIKIYDKGVTVNHIEGIYDAMVQYRSGDMFAPAINRTEALSIEINHFLDCIRRGKQPLTDGEAGLRVVRILDAAQQSLANGSRMLPLEAPASERISRLAG